MVQNSEDVGRWIDAAQSRVYVYCILFIYEPPILE